MNSSRFKSGFKKELGLLLGLFILNCLPYVKASRIVSEKELNRQPDQAKSEYSIDYKLTSKGVLYSLTEMNVTYDKVTKERTIETFKRADFDSQIECSVFGQTTYWRCMVAPVVLFGVGIVISIPIMIYDWASYPFYTLSSEHAEVSEETVPASKKVISPPKGKIRLTNADTKFDKQYAFKEGKVEIPFSELHVNNLWNSGDEESGKKFYYYFSVSDLAGNQVIPETAFNGVQFRNDQNFTKLSNSSYDKERQMENNQCVKKFGVAIQEGIKYIDDNGVNLRKDDLIVKVILGKACHEYKGTDAHESCINHFYDCVAPVRYISNKNLKYDKE